MVPARHRNNRHSCKRFAWSRSSAAALGLLLAAACAAAGVPRSSLAEPATGQPADDRQDRDETPWAFQPVVRPAVPDVIDASWPHENIDRFVLARLEAAGLGAGEDADRATLLRRLCFDLTGLPPTPSEIAAFEKDRHPQAVARVVDRLLASPHFGERWGRHWLDVARFAESSGGGRSLMFPHAWRFRDYVIESIDADKPFDRFILEQLAGDLLPHETAAQRDAQLIATGFLLLGPINYELQDKQLLKMEVVDEQIDTVGRAFLGMTLGCARCHDHKFDPIPMSDYYGLAGFFTSTRSLTPGNVSGYVKIPLEDGEEAAAHAAYTKSFQRLTKLAQQASQELDHLKGLLDDKSVGGQQKKDLEAELKQVNTLADQLKKQIAALAKHAPPQPLAMAVQEAAQPGDTRLLLRGQVRQEGPVVPRCFLTSLEDTEAAASIPDQQSGRLQLAQWIASKENPLTARVMANRLWHYLYGAGLVRTTDNFGITGEAPSHPQLLDYLASEFIEDGWSIKRMVRRLVLTRTYALSSAPSEAARRRDPENRLLAHANRRHLDAESLRDAMLVISGQLDGTRGGLTIRKLSQYDQSYQYQTVRRSVYVPRFRNAPLGLFAAFDMANPNVVSGRRNVSILPTQALYLMNSPFVEQMSHHTATRLLAARDNDHDRVRELYLSALGRPPQAEELNLGLTYLSERRGAAAEVNEELEEVAVYAGLCRLLFASLDFRYLN